jgi:hypothetical protein
MLQNVALLAAVLLPLLYSGDTCMKAQLWTYNLPITESCSYCGMYGLRITDSHLGCDAVSCGKWFLTFQRKMM